MDDGPDLIVTSFGIFAAVSSSIESYSKQSFKYGTELTYSALSWFALSLRADHVLPDFENQAQTFGVISPKIVLRNDFSNQATLTLQCSSYLLGSERRVNEDNRLSNTPSGMPDSHFLPLTGTMWW